jgi:hypothetical protein
VGVIDELMSVELWWIFIDRKTKVCGEKLGPLPDFTSYVTGTD